MKIMLSVAVLAGVVLLMVLLSGCAEVVPRECAGRWVIQSTRGQPTGVVYFGDVCESGDL